MTESTPERPRQVTLAAVLIMAGSVFVVLSVFDQIAGLHTLETRESVERLLAEPPADGLGLGVEGVLRLLRVLSMVAAGCATAAAILGYQVLQRSRSARLLLSVLVVPLFLTGMVTGGFMSSLVAAAAVMLWFQPSRDWFDGITRARPEAERRSASESSDGADPFRTPPSSSGPGPGRPAPFAGFGSRPAEPVLLPRLPADSRTRPPALIWACALTWSACGLVVLGLLATVAVVIAAPDTLEEAYRQNAELSQRNLSISTIQEVVYVTAGLLGVWSVAAAVLAGLAWRRVGWARVVLLGSAVLAAAVCLLATLGNFLMVFPLIVCVVSVVLLVRPDVRAWFAVPPAT